MAKIICIGSACKDIFFPTVEGKITETPEDLLSQKKISFELGAKYKIEKRFEALGGCAANVASGLAKLGLKPFCYSYIGDDEASEWIKKELKKNEVKTDLISQEKNSPSDLSSIIVDKLSGDRIIFSNQEANGKLQIISKRIDSAQWYFIGDLHGNWEDSLEIIFETARKKNIKVAYNPRQSNIHDNVRFIINKIPYCEVLFLNKDEAIEIISNLNEEISRDDMNDEIFLIKKLKDLGPIIVAMTDGAHGAWTYDGSKILYAPGTKIDVRDSTGAGDAFSSGFLSAHLLEKTLAQCLAWGICNGGSVVNHYGAIEGLLGESEIMEKTNEIKVEEVN